MRGAAPRLTVAEVRACERPVRFRMPFRFGAVTLTEAPQAFVRVRVTLEDGRDAWGAAAELLAPKWFDKDPGLSNEENFEQLRAALRVAAGLYRGSRRPLTAFGHFAAHHRAQFEACAARGLNRLVASFGPALLDRAALDALCRAHRVSFYQAVQGNLPGVEVTDLTPDLRGFDLSGFLASLEPRDRIQARHTVGLVDPITRADQDPSARVSDGLPETLEEVVERYGNRFFKLKVGGDRTAGVTRLQAIAAVLDRSPRPYHATLDGNEQHEDLEGALDLWHDMARTPALARLQASILFVEQPIARGRAFEVDVRPLARLSPVIIDESDEDLDAFPRARDLGYRGVSSKACKGLYKSLLNAARCRLWNREAGEVRYFVSAEDLTTQAGLAVQQDLALASILGLDHVERNGHHYVNGMAGLPDAEQAAFLAAHPDLYARAGGVVRVRIEAGALAVGSLACEGFAVGAEPDWSAMREMA